MARRGSASKIRLSLTSVARFVWGLLKLTWRSLPAIGVAGFFYFSFFGIQHLLSADPYFQIQALRIFPKGVLSLGEYDQLEKMCTGANLLTIDLNRLAAFVRRNPNVKNVQVVRHLPNELEIFMVPRKPQFQLWLGPRARFYTIDEDGAVVKVVDRLDPSLLLIEHPSYAKKALAPLEQYKPIFWEKFLEVVRIFRTHAATKDERIRKVTIDPNAHFSFLLANGPVIRIAEIADYTDEKGVALAKMLRSEERQRLDYVDLRHQDIVVRFKRN